MQEANFFATKLGRAAVASVGMMVVFVMVAPQLPAVDATLPVLAQGQQVDLA